MPSTKMVLNTGLIEYLNVPGEPRSLSAAVYEPLRKYFFNYYVNFSYQSTKYVYKQWDLVRPRSEVLLISYAYYIRLINVAVSYVRT